MTDREALIDLKEDCQLCCHGNFSDCEKCSRRNAIVALQEREERSKGCDFCKEDREGYTQKVGAYSLHKNELHTGHCKPRKIAFCPMCGRPLKGADNG